MKKFTKEIIAYEYSELSEPAKEKVKEWYLDDDTRVDLFNEDILYMLSENFPNSDLKIQFSLSCCQGDGLNIYGKLNMYDFLDKWNVDEKSKRTLIFYLRYYNCMYTFEYNSRYCYSCKFIDKKYINDYIDDWQGDLQYYNIKNIKRGIIEQFYNAVFTYFEELDEKYKTAGYDYLYNISDEEMTDICSDLDYYFTIDGKYINY